MKIVFVDRNNCFISEISRVFSKEHDVSAQCVDIEMVDPRGTCFVSPANCFGLMSGGIDAIYHCRMFRGIETPVKRKINEVGYSSKHGNKYLPIGSAIITPIRSDVSLMTAPTMYLPYDIASTQNAYHAFRVILSLYQQYSCVNQQLKQLVCPALCLGYGKMPLNRCVDQMYRAYCEWKSGHYPTKINDIRDPILYLTPHEAIMASQPKGYDEDEPFSVKS